MASGICRLPPELLVEAMRACESPHDIHSLIKAYPRALACFLANRHQVLRPFLRKLELQFGGDIPRSALLAARLRLVRQHDFGNLTTLQVEQIIEPFLASYLKGPRPELITLPTLCELIDLMPEVEWIMSSYVPRAWNIFRLGLPYRRPRVMATCKLASFPLELSMTERQRFYDTIFRFEGYCLAFFRRKVMLFEGQLDIRLLFFESRKMFDSIQYYINDQHWLMFNKIVSHLNTIFSFPRNQMLFCSGSMDHELHLIRFRRRTWTESRRFIHYLTSQGLKMLLTLQSMKFSEQVRFTLEFFFTMPQMHYPTPPVRSVNDGLGSPVVGSDPWMPWEFCDRARSYVEWRIAASFWDESRLRGKIKEVSKS
ncbi:hypothetical protein NM208_g11974 [Fusarium decemcellulare]|uniref:Uncharacterized protein n=1 Tax=Fusarium decemcellulare TaxID=57161 RepID=A0ACC1RQF5_9HYPO|nr:hypothetical protein NM208_g11974 [Fusarium decemcellulare]